MRIGKTTSMFVVAAAAMTSVACGDKSGKTPGHENMILGDTVPASEYEPETVEPASEGLEFTAKGIGVLQIGAPLNSLPEKADGLYSSKEEVSNDSFKGVYLYNGGSEPVAMAEGEDKIVSVTILGGNAKTAQGIYIGMPLEELKKVDGLEKAPASQQDGNPQEAYKLGGVTITIGSHDGQAEAVTRMAAGL